MEEHWLRIEDSVYEVSNHGRIRRGDFLMKVRIHRSSKRSGAYSRITLRLPHKTDRYIHRLVADAFIPNPDGLPEINHINGNSLDNRESNLEWCTREYNEQYKRVCKNSLV